MAQRRLHCTAPSVQRHRLLVLTRACPRPRPASLLAPRLPQNAQAFRLGGAALLDGGLCLLAADPKEAKAQLQVGRWARPGKAAPAEPPRRLPPPAVPASNHPLPHPCALHFPPTCLPTAGRGVLLPVGLAAGPRGRRGRRPAGALRGGGGGGAGGGARGARRRAVAGGPGAAVAAAVSALCAPCSWFVGTDLCKALKTPVERIGTAGWRHDEATHAQCMRQPAQGSTQSAQHRAVLAHNSLKTQTYHQGLQQLPPSRRYGSPVAASGARAPQPAHASWVPMHCTLICAAPWSCRLATSPGWLSHWQQLSLGGAEVRPGAVHVICGDQGLLVSDSAGPGRRASSLRLPSARRPAVERRQAHGSLRVEPALSVGDVTAACKVGGPTIPAPPAPCPLCGAAAAGQRASLQRFRRWHAAPRREPTAPSPPPAAAACCPRLQADRCWRCQRFETMSQPADPQRQS